MKQIPEPMLRMAVGLAALAGLVDVVAFLSLGGFFASFMSGNSTRLAIGINGNWAEARIAAGLIASFLAGVIGASLTGRRFASQRQSAILLLVAGLLALCAVIAAPGKIIPLLLLAAAMGALNTLFERDGEVSVGLTYMTGTLVRLGQHIAHAIAGESDRDDWMRYLLLWASFLSGGLIGVGLYARVGLATLWLPVAAAAALAWWLLRAPVPPPAEAIVSE